MDTNNFLEALNAFGAQVITLLSEGLDAAKAALPGFMSQAMTYWSTMQIFWTILIPLLTIGILLVGRAMWRKRKRKSIDADYKINPYTLGADYKINPYTLGAGLLWTAGIIMGLVVIFNLIPECIKMVTAPSLFFLEHAKAMFK